MQKLGSKTEISVWSSVGIRILVDFTRPFQLQTEEKFKDHNNNYNTCNNNYNTCKKYRILVAFTKPFQLQTEEKLNNNIHYI